MNRYACTIFLAALMCSPGFSTQQTSPSNPHGNPQDVPKQGPGTENPDVSKQRKQTPPAPGTNPSKNSGDVPEQQPGTDNPDVGKQRRSEDTDSSSTTSQKSKSKKNSKSKKQTSSASLSY